METFKIDGSELQSIQRSDFEGMENLKELSLYKNLLAELPEDAFDDLLKLEDLSLSQNEIVKLGENLFRKLVDLKELFLRSNRIETIQATLFEANTKLEVIWLQNNRLVDISPHAFSHLNLRDLQMKNNPCINADFPSEEVKSLAEIEDIFKEHCNENCEELTSDLSNSVHELSQCEEELENLLRENIQMSNQEKVCLIL